jgi:hypothetical protein
VPRGAPGCFPRFRRGLLGVGDPSPGPVRATGSKRIKSLVLPSSSDSRSSSCRKPLGQPFGPIYMVVNAEEAEATWRTWLHDGESSISRR